MIFRLTQVEVKPDKKTNHEDREEKIYFFAVLAVLAVCLRGRDCICIRPWTMPARHEKIGDSLESSNGDEKGPGALRNMQPG
jgi:hypothetical protein